MCVGVLSVLRATLAPLKMWGNSRNGKPAEGQGWSNTQIWPLSPLTQCDITIFQFPVKDEVLHNFFSMKYNGLK